MIAIFRYRLPEIALAARAGAAIASAHLQVRLRPVAAMRTWASPRARRSGELDQLLIAFHRAARRLPATCLIKALALQRFLAWHGHHSELRIGVAPGPAGLQAHAWLIDGERFLIGGGTEAETFKVLATWSDAAAAAAKRVH